MCARRDSEQWTHLYGRPKVHAEGINNDRTHLLSTRKSDFTGIKSFEFKVKDVCGHYTLNDQFAMCSSAFGLRKLVKDPESRVGCNLLEGYNELSFKQTLANRQKYDESFSIDQLISWEKSNPDVLANISVDFVVKHHFLKQMLKTPFERRDPWKLEAVKKNGRIYLSKGCSKEDIDDLVLSRKMAIFCGGSFEDCLTSLMESDDSSSGANGRHSFYSVYCASLFERDCYERRYNIYMSAEIDCVDGHANSVNDCMKYVELKTVSSSSVMLGHGGCPDFKFFRKLDWWLHCYLAGTSKLCVGHRGDDGTLLNIYVLNPNLDLRGLGEAKSVVMNFAGAFFKWLKYIVQDESIVYKVTYNPEFGEFLTCEVDPTGGGILNVLS